MKIRNLNLPKTLLLPGNLNNTTTKYILAQFKNNVTNMKINLVCYISDMNIFWYTPSSLKNDYLCPIANDLHCYILEDEDALVSYGKLWADVTGDMGHISSNGEHEEIHANKWLTSD